MAVFRVQRTRDYTVMSNYHLRDQNLTLKAKGLLSMMLSLPDEWNYTTRGLAAICKEGVDAIGSALKELESTGYIVRHQLRGANGRISDTEYIIYEQPHKAETPDTDSPDTENPDMVSPDMDTPYLEKPAELNIEELNTQKSITDAMKRPLAYITAPWGKNEFENTETAARYCRAVYDAGFSPVCPLLFLPLFLNDAIPQEHKDGIDIARDFLRRAHVLVVCGDTVDEAMKNDIAIAERLRTTATTLDGLLTVKGQGREKGGNRHG